MIQPVLDNVKEAKRQSYADAVGSGLLSSRFVQRTSRIAWYCRCRRFPFLAVRILMGGEFRTAFFAGKDQNLVRPGLRVTHCPECGNEFPRLRWADFLEEHCAQGFGP